MTRLLVYAGSTPIAEIDHVGGVTIVHWYGQPDAELSAAIDQARANGASDSETVRTIEAWVHTRRWWRVERPMKEAA